MLTSKTSRLARWRGIVRLAGRRLKQRWLESLFILLGIALGVGVFTGMETFVRFDLGSISDVILSSPQFYAVQVVPRRLEIGGLVNQNTPATRIDPVLADPVEFRLDDLLALRGSIAEIGAMFVGQSGRGYQITALDGESVNMAWDPTQPGPRVQLLVNTVSPDELDLTGRTFLAGTTFTWDDVENGAHRVVLEEEAARYLFPYLTAEETIGRTITTTGGAGGTVWTIVGIVADRNGEYLVAFRDEDPDFRRLQAYGPMMEGDIFREFHVTPVEGVSDSELVRQVQAYMDRIYGAGRVDVRLPEPIVDGLGVIVRLLALAGLALFIAAVNILNLFTARVMRRQRYTGMSIALGATKGMLFWQTAGEAILLGLFGSGLGLLVAHGAIRLLHAFLLMQLGPTPMASDPYEMLRLTPVDAAIGIVLGTGISILFGLYPAWLASRQDPAEALRAEA